MIILQHFDLEQHIWIKTNALGYAIIKVLIELNLDNLGQWHLVAYYLHKMIIAKTWYKHYNSRLLTILKAFKTWQHYLENCKDKVLIFINYNNLCCFMDTKILVSCHVYWAQKLSTYHFHVASCQEKVNEAADTLSHLTQQNNKEKANLWAQNTQILHYLQTPLMNASISSLNATISSLLPQHQIIICGIYILLQLLHFWNTVQIELANKRP